MLCFVNEKEKNIQIHMGDLKLSAVNIRLILNNISVIEQIWKYRNLVADTKRMICTNYRFMA